MIITPKATAMLFDSVSKYLSLCYQLDMQVDYSLVLGIL